MQKTEPKNWKKNLKNCHLLGHHGLNTTRNQPGPGFRPAEGPIGQQTTQCDIRPVSLHLRGAREGSRSGAYKPLRAPLN